MSFKKLIALNLSIVILALSFGLTLSVHFCHENVSGVDIAVNKLKSKITSEKDCCSHSEKKDSCCSNKIVKLDKKLDVNFSTQFVFVPLFLKTTNYVEKDTFLHEEVIYKKQKTITYCHSNAPPKYKLLCRLVLYS
jgi:hypothetical protein